ncbi:MAG: hypothetical protein MZW92_40010 [Comamonadaceae bacterium]|nr:hypothetical protein [Comamonadaceae bacterium]
MGRCGSLKARCEAAAVTAAEKSLAAGRSLDARGPRARARGAVRAAPRRRRALLQGGRPHRLPHGDGEARPREPPARTPATLSTAHGGRAGAPARVRRGRPRLAGGARQPVSCAARHGVAAEKLAAVRAQIDVETQHARRARGRPRRRRSWRRRSRRRSRPSPRSRSCSRCSATSRRSPAASGGRGIGAAPAVAGRSRARRPAVPPRAACWRAASRWSSAPRRRAPA